MWYSKHRPAHFNETVGQRHVKLVIKGMIRRDYVPGAFLFTGKSGTGKTLLARLFSRALNCECPEVEEKPCGECEACLLHIAEADQGFYQEIDCGTRGSVADVKEIQNAVYFKSRDYKIVVMDEAHLLSPQAQGAMLKQIEEAPPGIVYILCTTDPEKLLDTIHTRMFNFELQPILPEDLVIYLKVVSSKEDLNLTDEVILEVSKLAKGSARDAITKLEHLYVAYGHTFTIGDVYELFGKINDEAILKFLFDVKNTKRDDDLYSSFHKLVLSINPNLLIYEIFAVISKILRIRYNFQDCVSKESYQLYRAVEKSYEGDSIYKLMKFINEPMISKFYSLESLYSAFLFVKHSFSGFSIANRESKEANVLLDSRREIDV